MSQSDQPAGVAVDRGVMAPVPERTYTRADLLTALAAERHACSIVVWMTLMEALEPDADDKGLDGWMREAERRVKLGPNVGDNLTARRSRVGQVDWPVRQHCDNGEGIE